MQNAGLDESQAGIKITGRNINNLRYVDDPTVITKEELKSLLMKVKEETKKAGLKLNIQKPRIMASDHITSWQINRGKVKTVTDFTFLDSKITQDCSHEIRRCLLFGRRTMTNLDIIFKSRRYSGELARIHRRTI